MEKPLIAPSILSADFSRLGEEVRAVESAGADWIHVDVMDGHFVPNLTIGPPVISAIRKYSTLPFDVHLMIARPERYVEDFVAAGADWLVVHVEASVHVHRVIQQIRKAGARPGVAVNPGTPISAIEPLLDDVDMVLVMSVNPGFGGQSFIPSVVRKIEVLRKWIKERGREVLIEVDGGVNEKTIPVLANYDVDVYVAGTAVFAGGDYAGNISRLRKAAAGFRGRLLNQADSCDMD
ncbi:ribulose-phosphate 3-epimerase [Thermodesulforhabdus norvegica]|uniref:Ribulose-phosphate 3-epimerase n=1 Tax=Thermodesulforhabdus norvegica TaxID=39841 RepID=A0A1I4SLP0_9BACT|nr:ribulose-phosphate 3-epimerase [Thermodesulforhabdus norvegica]SFM65438.1 ribulose-5-phosphate 3-epimerase [Thermodesulforhabdus norvegica]